MNDAALERARLLGRLGLVVPLPFLFAVAAGRPFVVLALAGFALFFLRLRPGGAVPVLPDWALNLLGAAYVAALFLARPVVAPTLTGFAIHLLLFLAVIRLFSLRGAREEWTALVLLGILAVAAAATAVDIFIVLYLAVVAFLLLGTVSRMVVLDEGTQVAPSRRLVAERPVPGRRFVAAMLVAGLASAVPIFVLLPRTKSPFLRGLASDAPVGAGFADTLDMSSIGNLKRGEKIVFRASFEGGIAQAAERWTRFRGAVYPSYVDGAWRAQRRAREDSSDRGYPFPFPAEMAARDSRFREVEIDLGRTGSSTLFLPYDTVAAEPDGGMLTMFRDRAGIVALRAAPRKPLSYRAWLAAEPFPPTSWEAPSRAERSLPSVRVPGLVALAERLAPEGTSTVEAARRIEAHLGTGTEYQYTLDVPRGPDGLDPVEGFLFVTKRGHCEFFASAMVLMLRSRGIPARFVVGFAGGEQTAFGGELLFRQRHAHAWVEAFDEESGRWQVWDPTPAVGIPARESASLAGRLRQGWEQIQFFWDRYFLGFDFGDQFGLFRLARRALHGVGDWVGPAGESATDLGRRLAALVRRAPFASAAGAVVIAVLLGAAARQWARWRRRGAPARAAFDDAVRLLSTKGWLPGATAAATSRELLGLTDSPAAAPLRRIVELYEREAFGGAATIAGDQDRLREALRELRRLPRREDEAREARVP